MRENKICFIFCVNDEFLYHEAMLYIENLEIPDGYELEFIPVRDAESMAAGYQRAMMQSDAKYKIYMHQDVFIVNKLFLQDVLDIFQANNDIGLIGLAGCKRLMNPTPIWWYADERYGKIFHKSAPENIYVADFGCCADCLVEVAAVDGLLMATQYDLTWRNDLFKGWHFYDISQSREFIQAGYKVVVPHRNVPWVIHACGNRIPNQVYADNMKIFKANYRY